ncbi:hypothetical protein Pmani_012511 [Petrolisthes manimaculis]|uniref:USP domain-containing protein n=1 Tax=Petrolisthes manimaculis TaxID=1843537 RepID=A0AAE1Q0B7_9EUCA|nr:hypothetical protein Pmani_012511 [Petrolisthes manimaculis]
MDEPRELMLQSAEGGDTRELEAALQEGGAGKVERGKRGLLHLAAAGGYLNALKLLLHYQTDTSTRSSKEGDHGVTALHLAAAAGHEQVMEALLEAGADTEARDDKGKKPVHAAAYNGQLESLEVLRRYNCNLSAQSHARSTALHYAAFYGNLEVIKWLVRNGVKHDLKDKSGRLPKDVAKEHKHHDVHDFLKDYNGRMKDTDTSSNRGGSFRLTKKRRSLSVSSLFKNKSSGGDFSSRRQDDPMSPSYDRKSSPGPTSEVSSIRPPPSPTLDTSTIRKVEDWRARGMEATSLVGEEESTQSYELSSTTAPFTPASHYVHSTPVPPTLPLSPASHYTHSAPYSPTAPDASYTYVQEEYEIQMRRKELEIYELRMKMRQLEQKLEEMKHWGTEVERLKEAQKAWEAKEDDLEGEMKAAREEERRGMEDEMKRLKEEAEKARQQAEEERQRAEESKVKIREEYHEEKLGLEQQVYTVSLQIQQYHQKLEQQGRVEAELRGTDKAMQNALAAAEDTAIHLTQQLEETRAQLVHSRGQVEENDKLRKELEASKKRLEEREKHLEENKEQLEEGEKQLEENRSLERELKELKTQLEDRENQLEESLKLAEELEDKRRQLEETCVQLESTNKRLEQNEKKMEEAKKQLAQHQAREEEQESDIIDHLNIQITHLNTQIKNLNARLSDSEEARLTAEDEAEEREMANKREVEKLQQQLQHQEASHQQTVTTLKEEQRRQQQETHQKAGEGEGEVDQQSVSELRAQVHSLSTRLENTIQDLVMAETRQREQEAQSEKVITTLKQQLSVLHQQKQSPKVVAQLEAEKRELTKALEAVKKDRHSQEANRDTPEGSRAIERGTIQREVNAKLEVWRRDLLRERETNQKKLKEVSGRLEVERKEWAKTLDITQRRLKEVTAEYTTAKKEWVREKEGMLKQLQSDTQRYENENIQITSMYTTEEKTKVAEGGGQRTATKREGKQQKQKGQRKQEKQQTHENITQLIEELVEAKQEKGAALSLTQSQNEHWKGESSPDLVVSAVKPSTAGLPNLGNTCCLSMIMQCLYRITSLRHYFTSHAYKHDVSSRSGSGGEVAEAVARVMTSLTSDHLPTITRDLTHLKAVYYSVLCYLRLFITLFCVNSDCLLLCKSVVSELDQEFREWEQRDAHDLLIVLLSALHKDLLKNDETSVIQEETHGEEVAVISCEVYGEITRTIEPFSNLSLTIPQHRISLQAALARHYWLQGVEWDCPHCRRCHLCRHQISLVRLPPVLIIHLSRNSEAETTSKTKVDFPADNFTLSQHLPEGFHSPLYELVGVVSHHGTLSSDHYTAFCRSHSDQMWSLYNDHQVIHTSLQKVQADPDAYLLFYQRVK